MVVWLYYYLHNYSYRSTSVRLVTEVLTQKHTTPIHTLNLTRFIPTEAIGHRQHSHTKPNQTYPHQEAT